MSDVKPFLMFDGIASEAIEFYQSVFGEFEVKEMARYDASADNMDGKVQQALISIYGQDFMVIDSPVDHDFDFTPAISLFVTLDDEAEIVKQFEMLSAEGQVMMPLEEYPFAKKFAWVSDRFGVSWQLKLG